MMRFRFLVIAGLAAFGVAGLARPASGQGKAPPLADLVTFSIRLEPDDPFDKKQARDYKGAWKARRGEVVRVELAGALKDGWNTYPVTQRTSEQPESGLTRWDVAKTAGITPLWPIRESPPKSGKIDKETWLKHVHAFAWSQDFYVAPDAPVGKVEVPVKLRIQICQKSCYWYDHVVPVMIEVSDESPIGPTKEIEERLKVVRPEVTIIPVAGAKVAGEKSSKNSVMPGGLIAATPEEYEKKLKEIEARIDANATLSAGGGSDLLGFMLAGIFWGAISLITPCVFPMIPITVSFFLKQSEKEHHRPIVMASIYSVTIVIVLTLAAAFLLSVFRWLSIHPITNYFIGGLFVFFALSLFGMYEIELPQSLAQYTSAREGQGGVCGTIFMALTFTIISFACVAPFLGGFSGTAAAARPLWHNLLGGLAFAVTFASPFFFLALFPALLRQLPKSGSWLNSVKVVMGFLELAAAFKFFRTAELIQTAASPSLFTFDFVLGLWIALSVLCGLYLIGMFRLPHDTPEEHISVARLLFSAAFFGLALYLAPALFKVNSSGLPQRPGGAIYAWIDSFLLPESIEGDAETVHTASLDHAINLALEDKDKPKRIFIDFTGVSCTNCKLNEQHVFKKTQIHELFEPYILVKLYTDTIPAHYYAKDVQTEVKARSERDAKVNLRFQNDVFNTQQLPLYVVLEPQRDGRIRIVGVYDEGRINNEVVFAEFLRHPDGK